MGKNKNRTDLLAAGREKLQQFRKKKDTKGKSASKSSKSEQEGDADAEPSAGDPPASPQIAKVEAALPSTADVEARGSSVQHSTENSVGTNEDSAIVVPPGPTELEPLQEVLSESIASVNEEAVATEGQSSVDSTLVQDVGNEERENKDNTCTIEHKDEQITSLGPPDELVAGGGEYIHASELASVDSHAPQTTPSLVNQNEEKESLLSQELTSDVNSNEEQKHQEADSFASNQCDGRDEVIHGSLQDGESLGVGYIRLEREGDQESAVSGHREDSRDSVRESHVQDGTENLAHEAEGSIHWDGVSVISSNYMVEGANHDASVSVSSEASDGAIGATHMEHDDNSEGAYSSTQGVNEMDGGTIIADGNRNVGSSVSADAISREEGTLYTGLGEHTEVTTHRTEVNDTGDASLVAVTKHEIGDPETVGEDESEFRLEGVGLNSCRGKDIEIVSVSNDLGSERKIGVQADVYKINILPEESVPVSNKQGDPLEANLTLYGSQNVTREADILSVDLNKLAEVIAGLDEEDVKHLLKVRSLSYKPESEKMGVPEEGGRIIEILKQQLYFTTVAKDLFKLQLSEHIELQKDFNCQDSQLLNDVSKLNLIVKEAQDCNFSLNEELSLCKSDLRAMASGREELETQFNDAKKELDLCRSDLQDMAVGREELASHFTGVTEQLAQCRSDLQEMVAANEEREMQYTRTKEELAQCRFDLQEMDSVKKELETQFIGAKNELAQCRSDLQAMAVGKEKLETKFTSAEEELAQCRLDLQSMASEREDLEKQLACAREEIEEVTKRSFELQTKLERSHEEMANNLAELAGFRSSFGALEAETSNLNDSLTAVIDEKQKLEEKNTYLLNENERLATQLLEHQDHVPREHDKHAQLEGDLKEAKARLEELTEENVFLSSSLDVHKAKLTEIESQHSQLLSQATEARYQIEDPSLPSIRCNPTNELTHQSPRQVVEEVGSGVVESVALSLTEGKPIHPLEGESSVDSIGFLNLKAHIDDAEKTMQNLEKAIEGMHSHSVSLSKSGGKVAGAGVSKLIQAFELKVHDEIVPTELPLDGGERLTEDHFALAKEQTNNLRAILEKFDLSALKFNEEFKSEKSNKNLASVALYELQSLYEASKQQINNLEARTVDLVKSLSDYQSRTDDMHLQVYTLQQKSDEMEALFLNHLDNLQKDVSEKISKLEQEWNCVIAEIFETVENLNASTGSTHATTYSTVISDDLNVGSRIIGSVNAATKVIEDMHEKLGAAHTDLEKMHSSYEALNGKFSDLHVRNGLAIEVLGWVYGELKQFTLCSGEDGQLSGVDVKDESLPDLLNPSNYIYLLDRLTEVLRERSLLKSAKGKLEAELVNRNEEVSELKKTCIDLKSIFMLVENVKSVVELNDIEFDSDKPSISHLESLIAFLLQKYREACEKASSYEEELGRKMMGYAELQEKMDNLSSFSTQQEDENHILKKKIQELDGSLEALRSDLQAKGAELEQSEQRVSSVREKLSIAVTKGKGLIVQRDNLKQSLSEMSTELERCSQEVQLKEARVREVEAKLKAYSEAGERIEALESELSYIRNSATALRESFLLKDSVLQRIEEVLEELDFPEQFHSRDIIEKIEWLARSVSGNSASITDWDQKSSVGGGSYSDGGYVLMDGWKEEIHPISNSGLDDLKRKNEELQSKFYGLAEQNEMLEQSLKERNKLVQRWEEVLDRMDMPPQLRSMETEERIEWLGSALSEAHHDRDFLQKKIEYFESYCGSLTTDLERSQMKISDLELAFQGITRERELLSKSLENLSSERETILEVLDRMDMPPQLRSMETEERIEWLGSALSEAHHDRDFLQKKIDNFESYCGSLTTDLERSQMKISDLELAFQGITRERELLSKSLENLSSERETILEEVTNYELEINNLKREVSGLQEKLVKNRENDEHYHHVEGEIKRLQALVRDALWDQGADNVAHGGSETEYLEGLLRKLIENYLAVSIEIPVFKDVVKDRLAGDSDGVLESLGKDVSLKSKEQDQMILKEQFEQGPVVSKEEFEEALGKLAHEKAEKEKFLDHLQSMAVEFEALGRQRDELQEKLNQEEMKLVSTRDKLNVAVRKGKGLVAQRDSLKQNIEEMKKDMDHLKNEFNQRETTILQYQQNIRDLSTYPERVEALESECLFLRNRMTEVEHSLQDKGHTINSLTSILNAIDIGNGLNSVDPIKKMETIGKQWHDLQAAVTFSEQESKKSKRATELLLAELNEVHERADALQEELSKLESERDLAEKARADALLQLENITTLQSEERKNELTELLKYKAVTDQLSKGCFGFSKFLADFCSANLELLSNVATGLESLLKQMDSTDVVNLPLLDAPGDMFSNFRNEVQLPASDTSLDMKIKDNYAIIDVIGIVGHTMQECTREVDTLKENCYKHAVSIKQEAKRTSKALEAVHKEIISRKEKDLEILMMRKMIVRLGKACTGSILEIENQKAHIAQDEGNPHGRRGLDLKFPTFLDGQASFTEESINSIADTLLLAVKDSTNVQVEIVKSSQKELQATISNLQQELQENSIQKNRICSELVSQIKKAEADSKSHLADLQSATAQVENLEEEQNVAEIRIKELQEKIISLTDLLNSKGQEMQDLMQALDEEESQMEGLRSKNEELEKTLEQKNLALDKAMTKLSTTVRKFDELHQLSGSLLSEVENLQSQLQSRDAEISFLREEVTRCTNDVLAASQESNKRNSTEMNDLLAWLDMLISRFGEHDGKGKPDGLEACKETLEKQITSLLSELEAVHVTTQNKDALLQAEKNRTEELSHKLESHEITSLQGSRDLGRTTSTASEITEVEPMINKRGVASHVRSVRKGNNDQVAISIDVDQSGSTVDDEDDKVHGFKSLTTSRVVPRFTRPVSDMIDGLWVSCDRALMRQPALRLGIILYWFLLHTLIATSMI